MIGAHYFHVQCPVCTSVWKTKTGYNVTQGLVGHPKLPELLCMFLTGQNTENCLLGTGRKNQRKVILHNNQILFSALFQKSITGYLLIHSTNLVTLTAGSDNQFQTCPFVRPTNFSKSCKTKQLSSQIMLTTGGTVGLAEGIIDDTCVVMLISSSFLHIDYSFPGN